MPRPWLIPLLLAAALVMGSVAYYETNSVQRPDGPAAPSAAAAQTVEDTPGATTPDGGGANGIIPPIE